jgi:predicted DCC family thiol-disulfide oxidoreductase YuxK
MTSAETHKQFDKPPSERALGKHVVLFDGVCGLCNAFNNFIIDHDKQDKFMFAPLQSAFARDALCKYGKDPADLETVYVIEGFRTDRERLLERADAALFAFAQLGGWPSLSRSLCVIPAPLLRWGYDRVADVRYRLFGKYGACRLPDDATRARFIE